MIPVPLPGLLLCVKALAPAHLFEVARVAANRIDQKKSWPPDALRAYGVAACREIEVRGLDKGLTDSVIATLCKGYTQGVRKLRGRVPSVLVKYQSPSWIKLPELNARHRRALLMGIFSTHYVAQGWREQTEILGAGPPTLDLPPHDTTAGVVRWQFDTSKDW
jgi:hypothetical protein